MASGQAGGVGGKECAARHERSNDWPQGGARGARSAPPNPEELRILILPGERTLTATSSKAIMLYRSNIVLADLIKECSR